MGSSLIVEDLEMLGDTVNPEYRLGRGSDYGTPQPDQATITSIYLDGDVISGRRSHNRHMQWPVVVLTENGMSLAANVDALLQRVNQESFQVQWTPAGGLPVIFDCYRATVSRPRDLLKDSQGVTDLSLDFYAKPYGRSPSPQSVTAAAGSTQLDSFDTAPTGATLDTSVKFEGTGSARATLAGTATFFGTHSYATSTPISRTYGSAKDLSADSAVTHRFRWVAVSDSTVTATLTLTDGTHTAAIVATASFKANATGWQLVSFPLTGNLGSLNLTAVTGYTLAVATTAVASSSSTASFWVDDQRAQPPSSALVTTTHGANLLLPAILGSARTPANLALTASGGSFTQFVLHSPPGDQDPDAQILSSLSTGSTDQTVTVAAANAGLRGTYTLMLAVGTVGGATTATIDITQYENGSSIGSIVSLPVSWDSTAKGRLIPVGEVTFPLYDTPADNSTTSYTIRVYGVTGSDRYSELMLLDTRGQTIYTDGQSLPGTVVYVDEPSPLQSGSNVYVSASDRSAAFSKLSQCVLSGGPVVFDPGTNKVLAWVDAGTPTVTATCYPRWLDERVA